MLRLLKFEFKRIWKTKVLVLLWALCIAIAVMGMVLNEFFYGGTDDSYRKMLSVFNAYTQFSYLILGFLFVTIFAKDNTNGVVNFYKQIGLPKSLQYICKTAVMFICSAPIIDLVVIICWLMYGNKDITFLFVMLVAITFSILFIVLLAAFISLILKNTVHAVLVFYGLFVLFNILNLVCYGLTNPADGNSIVTFCMTNWDETTMSHYSLSEKATDIMAKKELICCLVPSIWCLILLSINELITRSRGK